MKRYIAYCRFNRVTHLLVDPLKILIDRVASSEDLIGVDFGEGGVVSGRLLRLSHKLFPKLD